MGPTVSLHGVFLSLLVREGGKAQRLATQVRAEGEKKEVLLSSLEKNFPRRGLRLLAEMAMTVEGEGPSEFSRSKIYSIGLLLYCFDFGVIWAPILVSRCGYWAIRAPVRVVLQLAGACLRIRALGSQIILAIL